MRSIESSVRVVRLAAVALLAASALVAAVLAGPPAERGGGGATEGADAARSPIPEPPRIDRAPSLAPAQSIVLGRDEARWYDASSGAWDDPSVLGPGTWTDAGDALVWSVDVPSPGDWEIAVTYAARPAGRTGFRVELGGHALRGRVYATRGWGFVASQWVGAVRIIDPGRLSIVLRADVLPDGGSLMLPKSIALRPNLTVRPEDRSERGPVASWADPGG